MTTNKTMKETNNQETAPIELTKEQRLKSQLKVLVGSGYKIQKIRIQIGNRLVGSFKAKLGQAPGTKEDDMEKDAKKLLKRLRVDYKIITEGIVDRSLSSLDDAIVDDEDDIELGDSKFPTEKKFFSSGIIDEYTELCMTQQYFDIEKTEKNTFKHIEKQLDKFSIWTEYLKDLKGIGPAIAGVIISEIDISKATYATSLWRLAGLDVGWDNKGRSKHKQHLIDVEYIDKKGKTATKKSITYKPLLKTKLMGIAGPSFLKVGGKSIYSGIYNEYKNRLENHPEHRDCYIAFDVEGCKKEYGKMPKNIYRKSYITKFYELCEARIIELSPELIDSVKIAELAKKLLKDTLGPYEIVENMAEKGLIIGPSYFEDAIADEVTLRGGVLRKPKEVTNFLEGDDEDENEGEPGIEVTEEFDDAPDKKGRKLWRLKNIGKTKAHRHQMATRYMVKRFLVELYAKWRALDGLPVMPEYSVEKLNMPHKEAVEGKGIKQ